MCSLTWQSEQSNQNYKLVTQQKASSTSIAAPLKSTEIWEIKARGLRSLQAQLNRGIDNVGNLGPSTAAFSTF